MIVENAEDIAIWHKETEINELVFSQKCLNWGLKEREYKAGRGGGESKGEEHGRDRQERLAVGAWRSSNHATGYCYCYTCHGCNFDIKETEQPNEAEKMGIDCFFRGIVAE